MNACWITAIFALIDELMIHLGHHDHRLAGVPGAEILCVAVVVAKYFQNHQQRASSVFQHLGYLSGQLSVSRFHRRLHKLAD